MSRVVSINRIRSRITKTQREQDLVSFQDNATKPTHRFVRLRVPELALELELELEDDEDEDDDEDT